MKHLLPFVAAAVVALTAAQAPLDARKTVRNVTVEPLAMQYGDTSRTALPFAKDPTVIRLGDSYFMYYSVRSFDKDRIPAGDASIYKGWHSAIATSTDLVHWTRVGDLDLRDTGGRKVWGAVAPCVKIFDGTVHLFYQKHWPAAGNNNNIWHAVSSDGITFTNTCDEPVFIADTGWSVQRSIDAEVYRVKDKMILMFATRDKANKIQMLGMAEAPYGSDYGPDKWKLVSTDGPFLKPEHEWEMHCIEAPTVIKYKGIWYMFYAGAYNHERQQIGLATSKDGRHFTRVGKDGLFFKAGEEGSWNHGESGHPGVFQDNDGQIYLFFQGKASLKANYLISVCKLRFD